MRLPRSSSNNRAETGVELTAMVNEAYRIVFGSRTKHIGASLRRDGADLRQRIGVKLIERKAADLRLVNAARRTPAIKIQRKATIANPKLVR